MTASFSFIHAADLHLDSPFRGMSYLEELAGGEFKHVFQRLRDCTFIALTSLVDLCIKQKVDFLLLAGDLFDIANRSLRAQLRFRDEMQRLAEAGISAFVISGNHDPADGWRADLEYPATVHFFSELEVESRPVIKREREIARVYGISYPQAAVTENLSLKFNRKPDDLFSIALLHTNVGSIEGYDNYAPCQLEDLLNRGFDYWALGHIHSFTVLHSQAVPVIYSGCHQGRSVKEMGPKGCVLVKVAENKSVDFSFITTDNIRWQVLEVSIEGMTSDQDLLSCLEERLLQLKQAEPGIAWVVRIVLSGRGSMHRHLNRPHYVIDLLQQLRFLTAKDPEAFVWPESIVVSTGAEVDKNLLRESNTLLGDFLKLIQQAKNDPGVRRQLLEALQPLESNPAVGRYLKLSGPEQLDQLLSAVETLGLDLLWEEES